MPAPFASLWRPGSPATVQSRPLETSTCMQKLLPGSSPEAGYKSGPPAGAPFLNSTTSQQSLSIDPNMARVRRVFCFSGVFSLLALAVVVRSQQGGVSGGFVRRQGAEFVLGGSPFLFNGFNSYWMMHVAAEPGERQKVSDVFREAAAAGLSVCRTWAFSDGSDRALQVSPGVYDEQIFQSLDFVVSEARRYGIRLILSLVNNFDDFGGRQQYVQWARSAGISINSNDDFYTNTVVKGYYRNHVKRVVTRYNTITKVMYKDDPTIMAWELINEPRCQADYSGRTVNAWAQEMAAYTKSLDSNHLLEVGMEGFYGDSTPEKQQYNPGYQVGTDFISTNLISEVDFATIHAYPDIWLSGQTDGSQDSFVQRWMWSHWQDAMKVLKKPLVFAEFGKSKKDPGYTIAERNAYIDIVYGDIYNFARSGGAFGGGLVWQIMAEGMDSYYDGYEIVLSQDATTDGVIARQSHLMTALSHTLSRPHGSTLGAAADLKAAQELSRQQPHPVHRPSSRSLRRHGRRLGRPARSETPPSK
ncbi:hypothetical protein Taro_016545 [Colocasia esculenta]|uniref:mannan endo-1,4-beta-mannosidase n=1 Tax=Colocasia esculenta TaxID=4460 RepID=A0A843UQL7_COLES|nr:hypothetical protein [Colocasia esculenta]